MLNLYVVFSLISLVIVLYFTIFGIVHPQLITKNELMVAENKNIHTLDIIGLICIKLYNTLLQNS